MHQSDAVHMGIFSRCTNRTQYTWVYSHDAPIGRSTHGYILTMHQSDAGQVGEGVVNTLSRTACTARTALFN
eukprot:6508901-Pyramimonas_sp.AAC.1